MINWLAGETFMGSDGREYRATRDLECTDAFGDDAFEPVDGGDMPALRPVYQGSKGCESRFTRFEAYGFPLRREQ